MHWFILLLAVSVFAKSETVDKIIIIVNQEPILKSDLTPTEDLEVLIDDLVIEQEIKKLGLEVSKQEIDSTIRNVMKQNNLSESNFEAALKSQNMEITKYRKSIKKQLQKMRLIQNKIKNRITVKTGSEIRLEAEKASFETEEDALEAQKNGKIKFQNMGLISKSDLLDNISKIIFSLKEGESSKPIKTSRGFMIIRVKKIVEIPLEKVDKQRYDSEVENAFNRYVKELRASAYIERK